MRAKYIVIVLMLFSTLTIFGQENSISKKVASLSCLYKSFKDQGEGMKKALKKGEELLIEKQLLKDASGESYMQLIKNITAINAQEKLNLGVLNYMKDEFEKGAVSIEKYTSCLKNLEESEEYKASRIYKLMTITKELHGSLSVSEAAELAPKILAIVKAKDFDYDYYKMMVFVLLEMYIQKDDQGIVKKIPQRIISDKDLENVFRVRINQANEIIIGEQKITLAELKKMLRTYLLKNTTKSIIALIPVNETSYKVFLDIQSSMVSVYKELRSELAQKKFNKNYEVLTKEQQEEVKKTYPLRLVE